MIDSLSKACEKALKDNFGIDMVREQFLDSGAQVASLVRYFSSVLRERYPDLLSEAEADLYADASFFHDIGKFLIDDKILSKPGRLTSEEYEIVKLHSTLGLKVLDMVSDVDSEFLDIAKKVVYMHHERWDGSGYPCGVSGQDIPIGVQIVALADVYEALRVERPYKKPFSHRDAVKMIKNGECGVFNPVCLELFTEKDCLLLCERMSYKKMSVLGDVIANAERQKIEVESHRDKNKLVCALGREEI